MCFLTLKSSVEKKYCCEKYLTIYRQEYLERNGEGSIMIIRVNKAADEPYVIQRKALYQITTLSWKAKAILLYLLHLPANWEVRVSHLVKQATDGRDAVYSALKELKNAGYVVQKKSRASNGKFLNSEYIVYEKPQQADFENAIPDTEIPHAATPHTDMPDTENPKLYNNNNINNKYKKIITAAISKNGDLSQQPTGASVKLLCLDDRVIGKTLTPVQKEFISGISEAISKTLRDVNSSDLSKQIEQCLLDPTRYSNAGKDFLKKMNTIKKVIHNGNWLEPVIMKIKQKNRKKPEHHGKYEEINRLRSEVNHWEKLYQHATQLSNTSLVEQFGRLKQDCQDKLQDFISNCNLHSQE